MVTESTHPVTLSQDTIDRISSGDLIISQADTPLQQELVAALLRGETVAWPDYLPPPIITESPSIWESIIDWLKGIASSISGHFIQWFGWIWEKIQANVLPLFSNLWQNIVTLFTWLRDQIVGGVTSAWDWVGETAGSIGTWFTNLWNNIISAFATYFSELAGWFNWIWEWLGSKFNEFGEAVWSWISESFDWIAQEISSSFDWLWSWLSGRFEDLKVFFTTTFIDWLSKPIEWVGNILGAIGDWFMEDIPGHSPRGEGIIQGIFSWIVKWFWDFPKWFADDLPERIAYGLSESFKWVGDFLDPVIESFNDAVFSFAKAIGPMSPDQAATNFSSVSKIGFAALAGLTGMTIAGEMLHPLKQIGLGNLAAVIFDMTNYKLITGAFVGTMAYSMLQTPLRYYFNSLFTPMLLREADFIALLSRGAFDSPELLRNERLIQSVQDLSGGNKEAYVSSLVQYYGYRPEYEGFFRELSYSPIGYFGLAGIARGGFFEEAWFIEALARTGYSPSARAALMGMFRRQYYDTLEKPVTSTLGKMVREGFYTTDDSRAVITQVDELTDINDVKALALELQTEYEEKSLALDISLRAFSRGVIPEAECRENLGRLLVRPSMTDILLAREKLGLIRRLSWTPPEESTMIQYLEV